MSTKEIEEWRNDKETQIRSKSDKAAYHFCCTTRTGVHVLYTELSSSFSFAKWDAVDGGFITQRNQSRAETVRHADVVQSLFFRNRTVLDVFQNPRELEHVTRYSLGYSLVAKTIGTSWPVARVLFFNAVSTYKNQSSPVKMNKPWELNLMDYIGL